MTGPAQGHGTTLREAPSFPRERLPHWKGPACTIVLVSRRNCLPSFGASER
jgi:hypothetical protein